MKTVVKIIVAYYVLKFLFGDEDAVSATVKKLKDTVAGL